MLHAKESSLSMAMSTEHRTNLQPFADYGDVFIIMSKKLSSWTKTPETKQNKGQSKFIDYIVQLFMLP